MSTPNSPKGASHLAPRDIPWMYILPIFTLLLAIAIPVLLIYSARAVLDATDGQQEEVQDPEAPGFEALVAATPSFLALGVDDNDVLTSVTVISLANEDKGGTVLLIPPETISPGPGGVRIIDAFATSGPDAARLAVARVLNVNVTDFQVVDPNGWERLTNPLSPLQLALADDLFTPDASGNNVTVFPAGTLQLQASEVGSFVGWINPGESPFNRMIRQRLFWTSWMESVAASNDPAAVPGESDVGLGRFVGGLSEGLVLYRELPVTAANAGEDTVIFQVTEAQVTPMVAEMMPFPVAAEPGDRPRVRLLDGVGGVDVLGMFSRDLALNGAQIVRVGNATQFGVANTVVVYHDDRFETEANAFRDLLQAEIRFEPLVDAVLDITVIIGQDHSTG